MLTPTDNYVEMVSWKRAVIDGVPRQWSNSFQFVTGEPLTEGTAWYMAHRLATVEQFIYPGDTYQFGFMVWQWSFIESIAAKSQVFIWPELRYGARPHGPQQKNIPWEYALLWEKQTLEGHSGRMAFRHTLLEDEVLPYREDGLAIPNHFPYGQQQTELMGFYLNSLGLPQAIFNRSDELSYPLSARLVNRVSIGALTKLQSIEDAQARKTPRALPYYQSWQEVMPGLYETVRYIYSLCAKTPEGMPKEDVQELSAAAMALKGAFINQSSYWTEGIKPVLMANWRPTSGLDPLSFRCQVICDNCVGGIDELGPLLEQLQGYPGEYIPLEAVKPFIALYSWYVLQWDRIGAMRFTGTPIRGVPKVYE